MTSRLSKSQHDPERHLKVYQVKLIVSIDKAGSDM